MSRIAKKPIFIPDNILIKIKKNKIFFFKGDFSFEQKLNVNVKLKIKNNYIYFNVLDKKNWVFAGTLRSIINNIILGINNNFSKSLILIGIGYKVFLFNNNILSFVLGFSHKIEYKIPLGIKIICPSSNEIIVSGFNKQLVGDVAAKIRSYRVPEKYRKGKGIRYKNEIIRIKEQKKKIK